MPQGDSFSRKWATPRQDFNAPDLYIPLMAFMTYVLLYGMGKGLMSVGFTPDVIIQVSSFWFLSTFPTALADSFCALSCYAV